MELKPDENYTAERIVLVDKIISDTSMAGMLVHCSKTPERIGMYSTSWLRSSFVPLKKGRIVSLQNS